MADISTACKVSLQINLPCYGFHRVGQEPGSDHDWSLSVVVSCRIPTSNHLTRWAATGHGKRHRDPPAGKVHECPVVSECRSIPKGASRQNLDDIPGLGDAMIRIPIRWPSKYIQIPWPLTTGSRGRHNRRGPERVMFVAPTTSM